MLATIAAALFAFSLTASPTHTVEFRVLRVPAGRGEHLVYSDKSGNGRYTVFNLGRSLSVICGDWPPPALSDESSLIDAGELQGFDSAYGTCRRVAEFTGLTLRVGRVPIVQQIAHPLWAVVTQTEERGAGFASVSVPVHTREALIEHATFTASVVPATDERVELSVSYTEPEWPEVKRSPPGLSPYLAPFYTVDPAAPLSPVPPLALEWAPAKRNASASARSVLRVGDTFVIQAGRAVHRAAPDDLLVPYHKQRRYAGWTEDDVIVFATVRE